MQRPLCYSNHVRIDTKGAGRTVFVREYLSKGQQSKEAPFARPGISHGPAGNAGRREGAGERSKTGGQPSATYDVSFLDNARSLPPGANLRRLQNPSTMARSGGNTQWARPRHVWKEETRLASRHKDTYPEMMKFEDNMQMLEDMAPTPLAGGAPRYPYHGFTHRQRRNDLRRENERVLANTDRTFGRIADIGRTHAKPMDWPAEGSYPGSYQPYMPGQEHQSAMRGVMAARDSAGGGNNPLAMGRGMQSPRYTALDDKLNATVPYGNVVATNSRETRADLLNPLKGHLSEELRDKLRVVPTLGLDVANNWGAGAHMMQGNYR
jgi:hypothetical protein